MQVTAMGMWYATGTNTAGATIPPFNGQIAAARAGYTSPGAGTLEIYRPDVRTKANAAVDNSTTLVIDTDASGYVQGHTPTTNDYVLVNNSSGSGSGWYMVSISAVAAVSSSTRSLTLASAIYAADNDQVYVIKAANIVSLTVGAETDNEVYNMFVGFKQMPVYVLLSATGTCKINGKYEVWD